MERKILIITMCLLVSGFFTIAQTLQKPTGQPGQRPLATPNIHELGKADLVITNATLISAVQTTKSWQVKVRVTVKNSGQLQAAASSIQAYAQKTTGDNSWLSLSTISFQSLAPGISVTREISFSDDNWIMNKVPRFNLKLEIDPQNKVAESNENNNSFTGILIGL
jgi:subtilase family serine protease